MNNESMLKIAICDDEQPIRDYLKKLTEKCTDAQVHVFANGEELLSDPTVYDIILLDISLNRKPDSGKPNGMEVAKKIRETSDVIIIFVTALKEYVFEGYDVGAFHYLLKPVDEQKFMEVMDKAISQIKKEKNTQPLIIRMDGNYIKIPVNNIIYAEMKAEKNRSAHEKHEGRNLQFLRKNGSVRAETGRSFFPIAPGIFGESAGSCPL